MNVCYTVHTHPLKLPILKNKCEQRLKYVEGTVVYL